MLSPTAPFQEIRKNHTRQTQRIAIAGKLLEYAGTIFFIPDGMHVANQSIHAISTEDAIFLYIRYNFLTLVSFAFPDLI